MFPFWVHRSPWFPPLFNTPRLPVCLDLEAARFGCLSATVWRKWLRLTEVPLGVLGNPPSGWSSPLRGSFGDFRGGLLGPVGLHVACLPHLHSASGKVGTCLQFAAVGSRPFDRRLEPLFSAWLGSLHSFCCARLTLVFGTAFQGSCGTRWRMSLSPRDRRTGSCWS